MKKYENLKILAIYPICNVSSLNIYQVGDYGEYVIMGLNNDYRRKYKIYTNSKGSYIIWGNKRYYLNEFMRADY